MISYGNQFKSDVYQGILKASDAIASTYGPNGSIVFLKSRYGASKFSKDGFSVAQTIEDVNKDSYSGEDIGIKLVAECSKRVNALCGDSSTGVTIIFRELVNQVRNLNLKDYQINNFITRLEEDVDSIERYLTDHTRKIEDLDTLKKVARTSSNDPKLGDFIAELVWQVRNNKINIDQSRQNSSYSEVIEGIQFKAQVPSVRLANKVAKPKILLTNRTITAFSDLEEFMGKVVEQGNKDVMIICYDIAPSAYSVLEAYQERGAINVALIRAPYEGKKREQFMITLADIIGTRVWTYATNTKQDIEEFFNKVPLGTADVVNFDKDSVNIIPSDQSKVSEAVKALENKIWTTEYDKIILEELVTTFKGKVGVLHLYADSESEFKEVKDRAEDAINSCKNSLRFGVSKGGGRALSELSDAMTDRIETKDLIVQPTRIVTVPALQVALKAPSRYLPEPTEDILDSTFSLIQSVKVAVSVLKMYLKLDYAVVNTTEKLL